MMQIETFSDWLYRLSTSVALSQVIKGEREVTDLVELVWAWIDNTYGVNPQEIELQVRTAIEESVQALQEDGELLYQPDIDALVERALFWKPGGGSDE